MFLPVTKQDMKERKIEQLDFIMISGDAYVDHASFGAALIARLLESRGYKVGMIAQPDWNNTYDFKKLGKPKLAFLVTAGNMDSMVNHYTVNKNKRKEDLYSPRGKKGLRPDRATIVYCNKIKEAFNDVPIIVGGVEASLRRLSHYDYWDDLVRRSILMDAPANLLVYGMGERAIVEIAEALEAKIPIEHITYVRGSVYKTKELVDSKDSIILPEYNEVKQHKELFASSFKVQYDNADHARGKQLIEKYNEGYVVQNPPSIPLSGVDLDDIYRLPFMNNWHPMYDKDKGILAFDEVKFSITANRGCFGKCHFCALSFHQGSVVTARSHEGVIEEAKEMISRKDFKGYIHDVGGPTANFMQPACDKQLEYGSCKDKGCLYPSKCKNLNVTHKSYLSLLTKLRKLNGVKKVFVRSGIRFDYLIYDKDMSFFEALCKHHISGQLRVAPEHISNKVLEYMGKPRHEVYSRFLKQFDKINTKLGKEQYVVPYLMSSHPGSTTKDAIELAEYLKKNNIRPKQVQDFYPTPSTVSTCMYYTNINPLNMNRVYVPKTEKEKHMQRALIQYYLPKNQDIVREALKKAKRYDLIGSDSNCLVRDVKKENRGKEKYKKKKKYKR